MATTTPVSPPIVMRPATCIPLGMVVAIVLLRLAIGWHFYREGTKKLAYNPSTGEVSLDFSAEGMLRHAVGPVGDLIRSELPNFHNWEKDLATPWQSRAATPAELAELETWKKEYAQRRAQAEEEGRQPALEFALDLPYGKWATRIAADWRATVDEIKAIDALSDEQRAAMETALEDRLAQLSEYLAAEATAIEDWRHELWRLQEWKAAKESDGLPFQEGRIAEKQTETAAASGGWIAQVRSIERGLHADLRQALNAEQLTDAAVQSRYGATLADKKDVQLHRLNVAVTALIIGVGVCLMLGLLTRLAALGGIAFLASVVATQPPWIAGADTSVFYYQLVEIAGLLVLFASAAGRWAGLDYFFRRCCGRKESV